MCLILLNDVVIVIIIIVVMVNINIDNISVL